MSSYTSDQFAIVPIDNIKVGPRHRRDYGDIDDLALSIKEVGLLGPIVCDRQLQLLAGERRLLALKRLGHAKAPVWFVTADGLAVEFHENEKRKPFTVSERVAMAEAMKALLAHPGQAASNTQLPPDFPKEMATDSSGKRRGTETREHVADKTGFTSPKQMERAAAVVNSGNAQLIADMDSGKKSISAAYKEVAGTEAGGAGKDATKTPAAPELLNKADAKAYYDRNGVPIPAKLKDVFADQSMQEALAAIDKLRSWAKGCNWNRWFKSENTYYALNDAWVLIEEALVHSVHAGCSGNGCEDCRNCGFLAQWRAEELAEQEAALS